MPAEPLRVLFCNDTVTCRPIQVLLERCGCHAAGKVSSAAEAIVAAGHVQPDAIVVDLGLTGDLGLAAVARLDDACPGSAVIVVSSFDTMRLAALEAGAYDFVEHSDLRVLERSLRRLAAEPRRVRRRLAGVGPLAHVDIAPTSAPTADLSGSVSTKAPES